MWTKILVDWSWSWETFVQLGLANDQLNTTCKILLGLGNIQLDTKIQSVEHKDSDRPEQQSVKH